MIAIAFRSTTEKDGRWKVEERKAEPWKSYEQIIRKQQRQFGSERAREERIH